jgi:hypothetical protein
MVENDRKQPHSKEVPEEDRLKVAAIAMESNEMLHKEDKTGKRGSKGTIDQKDVEKLSESWSTLSKEVLQTMMKFYGQPNEMTLSQATWYYNGPWKRTTVHKDGYVHDFPEPHVDMLEQVIDYHVPKEKVGDIGLLEGSLIIDRTKGEVAVHCDNEGANTLSLNMMHEVVSGERTPEEARQFIVNELPKYLKGESAPYAEAFQFDLPEKEQGEPDQREVFDDELTEKVEKAKEKLKKE